MKRSLHIIVRTGAWSVVLLVASAPSIVSAACNPDTILGRLNCVATGDGGGPYTSEATTLTLSGYVGSIINAALALIGVIFFAQMVYAGYLWMTARGEKEPVENAQDTIKRSIIGIVIVLAAWGISSFVVDRIVGAARV